MLPDDAELRQESIPLGPYGLLSLHVPLQLVVLLDEGADNREGGCLGCWLRHGLVENFWLGLSSGLDVPVRVQLVAKGGRCFSSFVACVQTFVLWRTSKSFK